MLGFANAQYRLETGFIVTNHGDTLNGLIQLDRIKNLNQKVSFCLKKGDIVKDYFPKDLKAFYIYPNLYFESHEVSLKATNSRMVPQKVFLYKIQSGYLSVFKVESRANNAFFIKKIDEDRVTPLYMCVRDVSDNNYKNRGIDTITEFNINTYVGRYTFYRNYVDTLKTLFQDWKEYKSFNFNLTEVDIVAQVAAYNKAIHKEESINSKPLNFLYTLTAKFMTPLLPRKDILRAGNEFDEITQLALKTPFIGGYELGLGLMWKGKNIGLSTDIGMGYVSKAKLSYTAIDSFKNTISKEINVTSYKYAFLEAKTLFRIANSSPYVGVRISLSPDNFKSPLIDYKVGYLYQLNDRSAMKIEFDIQGFLTIPRVYTIFGGIGYQYFLNPTSNQKINKL